ncbi:hypothetical protein SASPL_137017 [Salvia splendens]|uniref:Uncharacterized protein n=1 Tax=Salvia splendens TaxID=180675 RepID=A0A8X8WSF6_SALSN|nr:hypothetical protein SASPL_137017 [Salvia splendens]
MKIGKIGAVLVVALALALEATAVVANEKNGNVYCMDDCYNECMQIKIFNEAECNKECSLACAKYAVKKALREDEDYNKFFPYWI